MMLRHLAAMGRHVATGQNTAVDPRMQRLDPSVENFRKAGEFADRFDLKPSCSNAALVPPVESSSTPWRTSARGQLGQARFVGNAQQRA